MGKFNALQVKFDKDYLNQLTEDPGSGVSKQNCKYHIGLHPAQFTDFGQSIKDELGRKLGEYDDIFEGIMLGFEKVNLKSDLGVIGIDNCYVHVDIQADFFVFKPEIGMILKGVVTRTTTDHVGCLVYSTFNISLPKPEDGEDFWLGKKATVQSEVLFKIICVDLSARLPYIRGELLSIINDNSSMKKSKKLSKKIKFENQDEEDNLSPTSKLKKNHKKVHANDDESMANIEMNGEVMEERKVTGKRKRSSLEDNEDGVVLSISKKKHKKKNKNVDLMENLEMNYDDEFDVGEHEIKLEDDHQEEDNSTTKIKKKRKKSHKDVDHMENLKLNYEQFQVEENEIKIEDNHVEEDYSTSRTKKKRKESFKTGVESMENLERKNGEFADNNKSKLEDNYEKESYSATKTKKKRKESYNRGTELVENLERNNAEFVEDNKSKIEDNYEEEGYSTARIKKKHKESYNRGAELMENLERTDGEFAREDDKIKLEDNYEEENYPTTKTKKKRKKGHKADLPENLEIEDEEFKIDIDEIKLEDHYKEEYYSTPKTKKNHKKNLSKEDKSMENLEMTVNDLVREEMEKQNKTHKKKKRQIRDGPDEVLEKREKRKEKKKRQIEEENDMKFLEIKSLFNHSSVSLQSNASPSRTMEDKPPKSKEKRKKELNTSNLVLDNVQIKEEPHDNYWDSTEDSKKRRKEKQHEHTEEVLKKIDNRPEKKARPEIDDSLESLDIKGLFDASSVNLNSSYSQTMANDEDRGKKRRKSTSMSQEVYLDKVKLEEDSELEKIISGKKRKRSKSMSV